MAFDENNAVMAPNKIGDSGRYKRHRCGRKARSFAVAATRPLCMYVYSRVSSAGVITVAADDAAAIATRPPS